MVMAVTATSIGSCEASSSPRSITTDVSRMPRCGLGTSVTWRRVLVSDGVQISSEPLVFDPGRHPEGSDGGFSSQEAVPTQGCEFSDRCAVSGDDETLAVVKLTHDLTAVIAEFTLGDLSSHALSVAQGATGGQQVDEVGSLGHGSILR